MFFFAKIPTWFNTLNNSKNSYNDEVFTSVLLSMRISMTLFEGYKPIRNPFEVGKLSKVLQTSSDTELLQFTLLTTLVTSILSITRIISVMLVRKEEKKGLFEEYFAHIEDYEGQQFKLKGKGDSEEKTALKSEPVKQQKQARLEIDDSDESEDSN